MEFEWNDANRLRNLDKHGIDFAVLEAFYADRAVITIRRGHMDEVRWMSTGIVESRFITVVWTTGGTATRIVSARRAWDSEKRTYRSVHGDGT